MNELKNSVQLIGRLGADPETNTFDSGKTLTKFSIATNESYKNADGEWKDNTQWHNCIAWGKTGEILATKLHKGDEVIITGRIAYSQYENKDGVKMHSTDIEVNGFLTLNKKEKE